MSGAGESGLYLQCPDQTADYLDMARSTCHSPFSLPLPSKCRNGYKMTDIRCTEASVA